MPQSWNGMASHCLHHRNKHGSGGCPPAQAASAEIWRGSKTTCATRSRLWKLFTLGRKEPFVLPDESVAGRGYLGNFSDFTVGATYSLGRDASAAGGPFATNCARKVAGNSKACRQVAALLGYDNKAWGVTTSYYINKLRSKGIL